MSLPAFYREQLSLDISPHWENREKAVANMRWVMSKNFRSFFNILGDGNCLIYSIIISLYYRIEKDEFLKILRPFCTEEIFTKLVSNPESIILNTTYMKQIAKSVREWVVAVNDFTVDVRTHMDPHAIDNYARLMVLRLLCVNRLNRYTLIPDPKFHDADCSFDDVSKLPNIRPDVTQKYTVDTLSTFGFTHYTPLFV
jgi:hypothetical protein